MKIKSILSSLILLFCCCVQNIKAQTPTIGVNDLYLVAQPFGISTLNFDGLYYKQVGLSGVPTATDLIASPTSSNTVFIDMKDLNGHTLNVNSASQIISNLIITDFGAGVSGKFSLSNNLTISGNATATTPSTLCVAPTATIIGGSYFVLTSTAGGTVNSATLSTNINIPNLQINSTDYSNPFILRDNLVAKNLSITQGYFNSNAKKVTINTSFRIGLDQNTNSNARVNLDGSNITINGNLSWYLNNSSIPTTTLNYSGINTRLKIVNPIGDNTHVLAGKINSTGKIDNIYNQCDKPLTFITFNVLGNQIPIDSVTSVNSFSNFNYTGIGLKIGVLSIDKGLMLFSGLSNSILSSNRFEITKLLIGNTCANAAVLIDGYDNAHIWLTAPNTIGNVAIKHLQIDNSVLTCTNSINLGGNSALVNIASIAPITNLWWKGSIASSDWNTPSNWCIDAALTTIATCIPGINTNVYFIDHPSVQSYTVTTNGAEFCANMQWNNTVNTYTFNHLYSYLYSGDNGTGILGNKIYVNGSLNFPISSSKIVNSNNSSFEFCGSSIHSVTSNGTAFNHSVFFLSSGSYALADDINLAGQITYYDRTLWIQEGNFNSNGKSIYTSRLYVNGLFPKNVNFSNSKIYLHANIGGFTNVGTSVYLEKNSGVNTTTYTANSNTDWIMNGTGPGQSFFSYIQNEYLGNVISNSLSDGNPIFISNAYGNGANPLIFGKIVRQKGDIIFHPYQCSFVAPGPLYIMDSLCYRTSGNVIFSKGNLGPATSYSINVLNKIITPNTCSKNYKLTGIYGASIITPTIGISSTQTIYNTIIENTVAKGATANAINSLLQGTSSGWTITPPSPTFFYWIGEGATANWNDWMNWKLSVPPLVGAADDYTTNIGQCIPGFADNVFFHANSFPIKDSVCVPTNISFNDMTWINSGTGAVTGATKTFTSTADINVYGSLLYCNNMKSSFTGNSIKLFATDAGNLISSRGATFNGISNVSFLGSGAYKLTDSLIIKGASIIQYQGNLDASSTATNTTHIDCFVFNSGSSQTATLNISGTLIDVTSWGYGLYNFGINTIGLTYLDNSKTYVRLGRSSGYGGGLAISVGIFGDNPINFRGTVRFLNSSWPGYITQATTLGVSKYHNVFFDNVDGYIGRYISTFGGALNDTEIDSLTFSPDGGKNLYLAQTKTLSINNNFEVSGNYCRKNNIYSNGLVASGVQAYLCGTSSLALKSKYINIRDINSASCAGFASTYSAVVNSTDGGNNTGWSFGPTFSPLPGFTTNPTLLCNQYPATITTTGFYSTPATTFSWTSPTTTLTATQAANDSLVILNPGTYSLAVTYGTGCFFSDVTTYSLTNNLTSTLTTSAVKCNLGSTGAATIAVTNQSSATNYSWNLTTAGLGTLTNVPTTTVSSLTAGNYTMTVNDPNCARTLTFTITQPTAFTLTPSTNSLSCFAVPTGTAGITVSGATPVYTYSWAPAVASTTNTASGLSSGTIYTVTVKDLNNCIASNTLSIAQPTSAVSILASSINSVTCFGATTGSVEVTATGGTPVYTYSWAPSVASTTNTALGLATGIYTATIKDANGCTTTKTVSVTQPTSAVSVAATSQTNVLCFGGTSATASLVANGGTPIYTYSWNPSVASTTNSATGLSMGTYTATISDNQGCIKTQTFTITQPPILDASITNTSTSNCGVANGSATVSVTGGTSAYTYSWVPPSPATSYTTSSSITNSLPAGTNNLIVLDANGCTYSLTVNITNPSAPTLSLTLSNVLCYGGATGSASVSATGGTPAYTYTWSNSSNAITISSLIAGNYGVTITDNSLCQVSQTFVITEPALLSTLISDIVNVNCFAGANGSASITPTGGTAGYTYNWSPTGGTTNIGTGLSLGIYTVSVIDVNNCSTTNTVQILGISDDISIVITDTVKPDCGNYTNGAITVSVTGGTPNYTYLWNTGANTPTLPNISNNTYTVTVTDFNNCSKQLEFTLDCYTSLFIPEIFSPNGDGKNDVFEIKGIYQFPNNKLSVFNRWGSLVYQKNGYHNEWDGKANVTTMTGRATLAAGTYYVIFDFGDDDKSKKPYTGFLQLEY